MSHNKTVAKRKSVSKNRGNVKRQKSDLDRRPQRKKPVPNRFKTKRSKEKGSDLVVNRLIPNEEGSFQKREPTLDLSLTNQTLAGERMRLNPEHPDEKTQNATDREDNGQAGRNTDDKQVHFASPPGSVSSGGDGVFHSHQTKFNNLYADYRNEQTAREEAERAFRNLMQLYESKMKRFQTAVDSNRQAFEIAEQMKKKYYELRLITEENMNKLSDANETIALLKQLVTQEKRKTEKIRHEMKILKQPVVPDHSACDVLVEQERKDKEDALEEIRKMCEEINEIKGENELIKNNNKEIKEKMVETMKINNELGAQNQTLLVQFDTMKDIIKNKDNQIKSLLERNPMNDLVVQNNLQALAEAHENEQAIWRRKEEALSMEIETLNAKKSDLELMVEQRIAEIQAVCKEHHVLKRDYEALAEKFVKEIVKRDQSVVALLEAAKSMKNETIALRETNEKQENELALLREANRVKDIEIGVLGDAKALYEDQIKVFQCEKEAVHQIAKQFEQQIDLARAKLSELETHKCCLYQQLAEANEQLQKGKDNNLIQEKILEDTRDTVCMLKCRLRECSHQLYKCQRERDMLLCERG